MPISLHKVVLDTNVLIFAIIFGGRPREVLDLVINYKIKAFTSPILVGEMIEVLTKKFGFEDSKIKKLENQIREDFEIVYPIQELDILRDNDDNRVLEAALEGHCDFIISGDKELLELKEFMNIKIVTIDQFLKLYIND